MKTIPIARPVLAILMFCLPLRAEDELEKAFRDALYAEEVKGDTAAALKAYQDVSAKFEQQRDLAATAIYRQAECQRKLGRADEAVALYTRAITQYGDRERVARLCREALTAMGKAAPEKSPAPAPQDEEAREIARLTKLAENSPDLLDRSQSSSGTPGDLAVPLDEAARRGQAAVVAWLLKAIPKITPARLSGPLVEASTRGHLKVCELLIAAGADINTAGALNVALANKRPAVARLLLTKGANARSSGVGYLPDNVFRNSCLHPMQFRPMASGPDREEGIPALVTAAGSPDIPEDVVAQLLAAGADGNAAGKMRQWSSNSQDGWSAHYTVSPLGAAVAAGSIEKVKLLLGAKADVNQPAGDLGATPLMLALASRNTAVMNLLVSAGADWKTTLSSGATALHVAAAFGFAEGVEAALSAGLSASSRDSTGCTPLHAAVDAGSPGILRRLLALGASPDVMAEIRGEKFTPLRLACSGSPRKSASADLVQILLEAGANPNLCAEPAFHPLRAALGTNFSKAGTIFAPEVVELLIAKGAKPAEAGVMADLRNYRDLPREGRDSRSRNAFLAVWQAVHRRDNPRLARAVWLDDGLASYTLGGMPVFSPQFSADGALTSPPSWSSFVSMASPFFFEKGKPARDWTRVQVTRLRDGVSRDTEVNVLAMAETAAAATPAADGGFALEWGDIVTVPATAHADPSDSVKVKAWCQRNRLVSVRMEMPGGALVTGGAPGDPSLLSVPAQAGDWAPQLTLEELLTFAGIPAKALGFTIRHRHLSDSGLMEEVPADSAVFPGDLFTMEPGTPEPQLSGRAMSGGLWLCESLQGPFYPVPLQKYTGSGASGGQPLGALLVALAAPHPLPFHHTDWEKALVRTVSAPDPFADAKNPEPQWKEEKLLQAWPFTTWGAGTVLILPQNPERGPGLPPELAAALTKSLSASWRLASGARPEVTVQYAPVFFRQDQRDGKTFWARVPDSSAISPLLPRSLDVIQWLSRTGRITDGNCRVILNEGKGEGWLVESGDDTWLPEGALLSRE